MGKEEVPGADLDRSIEIMYTEISQLVAQAFEVDADDGAAFNFRKRRR